MSPSVTPPLGGFTDPGQIQSLIQLAQQLNTMLQMQRSIAYKSTPQAVASGAFGAALTFDTNQTDNGSPARIHDPGSNPTRFTAQAQGLHLAIGQVRFDALGAGVLSQIYIKINGAIPTFVAGQFISSPAAANNFTALVVQPMELKYLDYIEFFAAQVTGGPLNTIEQFTWGSLILLSRL
jgi:hypothetical protein